MISYPSSCAVPVNEKAHGGVTGEVAVPEALHAMEGPSMMPVAVPVSAMPSAQVPLKSPVIVFPS